MIHMEERHLKAVQNILKKYPYTFFVFGSRVHGTQKNFSDLDLCVKEDLSDLTKCYLQMDFDESNLPFKVDIIEWNKISKDFQSLIEKDLIQIYLDENSNANPKARLDGFS
jgi:uncharacterized protein